MTDIRRDKFKVGDMVTWSNPHYADLVDGQKKHGKGPFKILKTTDVIHGVHAVGHLQHVLVSKCGSHEWSGAFFKKMGEPDYANEWEKSE
jgi:hypothetical protein